MSDTYITLCVCAEALLSSCVAAGLARVQLLMRDCGKGPCAENALCNAYMCGVVYRVVSMGRMITDLWGRVRSSGLSSLGSSIVIRNL